MALLYDFSEQVESKIYKIILKVYSFAFKKLGIPFFFLHFYNMQIIHMKNT